MKIYNVKKTCINKIDYYDTSTTIIASTEAEAWSKAYPDSNNKLSFNEYNSNFNWVNTWFKSHFKVIIEKLAPFLLFLILFFVIRMTKKSYYNIFNYNFFFKNKNMLLIISFTLYCCFLWFLKFPGYFFKISGA